MGADRSRDPKLVLWCCHVRDSNAKEIRVQKQPNLSYTREGVLEAVVAGKEYFKPQITWKWKGTRRAKCWVQFYYPEERLKEVASE